MLDKKYDHKSVEEGKYEGWLKYFEEREDELDSLFVTDRGNPATGENLY